MKEESLSFKEMADLEPELLELEALSKGVDGNYDGFCANKVWYQKIKLRLSRLVGDRSESKHEVLKGGSNYHTAQYYLAGLLPPCRKCSCLGPHSYPQKDRNEKPSS